MLRALRLRALADEPSAFGSTYARELAFTTAVWEARLQPDAHPQLVCESDAGTPVGIAAGVRDAAVPAVADLVGMWVDVSARGSGAADALVAEVVCWAEHERISVLRLHVTEGNSKAVRLYERHGFRPTGTTYRRERDGVNEIEMERRSAP